MKNLQLSMKLFRDNKFSKYKLLTNLIVAYSTNFI